MFSISCSFSEHLRKVICWCPLLHWRVGAPSYGNPGFGSQHNWLTRWVSLMLTAFYLRKRIGMRNRVLPSSQWWIQDFQEGRQLPRGYANLLFWETLLKEFGPRWGRPWSPLDPPLTASVTLSGSRNSPTRAPTAKRVPPIMWQFSVNLLSMKEMAERRRAPLPHPKNSPSDTHSQVNLLHLWLCSYSSFSVNSPPMDCWLLACTTMISQQQKQNKKNNEIINIIFICF